MQEYVITADGKKRKAESYTCENCSKSFTKRKQKGRTPKFCSKECQSASHNVECKCCGCGKDFTKRKSTLSKSRSGLYFCSRSCKDKAQKIGGIKEIQPSHYGTATENNYRQKFDEEELVCSRCGYKEFACSVEIHHIDHNRLNNEKSNLIPLCANCHSAYHHRRWAFDV